MGWGFLFCCIFCYLHAGSMIFFRNTSTPSSPFFNGGMPPGFLNLQCWTAGKADMVLLPSCGQSGHLDRSVLPSLNDCLRGSANKYQQKKKEQEHSNLKGQHHFSTPTTTHDRKPNIKNIDSFHVIPLTDSAVWIRMVPIVQQHSVFIVRNVR